MTGALTRTTSSTREGILHATRLLLERQGLRGVRLDDVLRNAHVSKGAVYHHFTDFDALIEEAQLDWYREIVEADIESLRRLVEVADAADLRAAIAATTRAAYDPTRRSQRTNRIMILAGVAFGSDEMRLGYARLQSRLNDALAQVIAVGQSRGLIEATLDAGALAAMLFALTFGRAFNELADIEIDPDADSSLLLMLLRDVLVVGGPRGA